MTDTELEEVICGLHRRIALTTAGTPLQDDLIKAVGSLRIAVNRIAELEAQMPKEGEWMRTDAFPHRIYCSVCYKTYVPNDRWEIWVDEYLPRRFCPNCGARMKTVTDCHTLVEEKINA